MYLYSILDHFTPTDDQFALNSTDGIVVPRHLWDQWSRECSTTMIVALKQDSTSQVAVVASFHDNSDNTVYAPQWMFHRLSHGGLLEVDPLWLDDEEEPLPLATKITLKPLDNVFYHASAEEELSEHLKHFQSLQAGCILSVPLKALGGYEVDVFVESCEPASCVLLRGEVPLELSEPIETVVEWRPPSAPTISPPPTEPVDFENLLPNQISQISQPANQGFVPFQGTGRRLRD